MQTSQILFLQCPLPPPCTSALNILHFPQHSPSPPPLSVLHYHLYLPLLWVSITTTSLWWAHETLKKSWSCGEQWMLENQRRTIYWPSGFTLLSSSILHLALESFGGLSQTYLAIDAQQTHQWKYNIMFVVNPQASPFVQCQSWIYACVKTKFWGGHPVTKISLSSPLHIT